MESFSPKKSRVLFVCPSLAGGGAERMLCHLLRNWDRQRFEIQLLLFSAQGAFLADLPKEIVLHNLGKKRKTDIFRLILTLAFSIIPQLKPMVIISFLWYANLVVLLASLLARFKPKVVISERISIRHEPGHQNPLVRLAVRLLYPQAKAIVAVSNPIASQLRRIAPCAKIVVIPNGLDFAFLQTKAKSLPEDDCFLNYHGLKIVACGRLTAQKNYQILLKALHQLPPEYNFKLFILGEGELRPALEKLIEQYGLKAKIIFLGFKPNPYPFLSRADIFVHTANYEGFSNVVLEAMGLGLAIIATDCPSGPGAVIRSGLTGLLVRPNSPQDLACGLKLLIENASLRAQLKAKAFEEAQKYSIKKIVCQYEGLCQ